MCTISLTITDFRIKKEKSGEYEEYHPLFLYPSYSQVKHTLFALSLLVMICRLVYHGNRYSYLAEKLDERVDITKVKLPVLVNIAMN